MNVATEKGLVPVMGSCTMMSGCWRIPRRRAFLLVMAVLGWCGKQTSEPWKGALGLVEEHM